VAALEPAALSGGEHTGVTQKVKQALGPWLRKALPASHCVPGDGCYARHLIHCDPGGRWCVVAIVLADGQSTPVHNHKTWGVIGVVSGREREIRYHEQGGKLVEAGIRFNEPGEMSIVIPPRDIHRIEGANPGGDTVSIHVYGGDVDQVTASIFELAGIDTAGPCATKR
jgi:predicted metal-dependent enzyme (double-stranded beta helix superfamily)